MAEPARRPEMVDSRWARSTAVQRAYRLHEPGAATGTVSGRRSAQASRWSLLVLVAASVYLSIVIWHQISAPSVYREILRAVEPSNRFRLNARRRRARRDVMLAVPADWAMGERVTALAGSSSCSRPS
jgi:hypothetical protein